MEAAEEPGAEEREESGDNEVPESGPEALSAGSGEPEGPAEPPEPAEPEGTAPGAGEERSGAEEAAPAGGDPEPAARGEAEEAEREEREALLAEYRALEAERQRLHQADGRLQLLLGEALRSQRGERRADEAGGQQLFAERLRELRELWRRREREAATWQQRVDARRRDRAESEARAGAAWAAFQARKKAVAVQTLGRRRGGREAALRTVGDIQARERDKETSVREVSAAPPAPRAPGEASREAAPLPCCHVQSRRRWGAWRTRAALTQPLRPPPPLCSQSAQREVTPLRPVRSATGWRLRAGGEGACPALGCGGCRRSRTQRSDGGGS